MMRSKRPNSESERTENKQSLSETREIVESVAAFATANGGTIRIGITPDGTRKGIKLGRATLEQLANQIKTNTEPPQYPSITIEGQEDSAVITVAVEESPLKPVWAYGRPFKRVGRTNQRISRDETKRLMDATAGRTWDALPCPDFRLKSIDRRAVKDYLTRASHQPGTSVQTLLRSLNLIASDKLCNAAALLFARNPTHFTPEVQVKCARFLGTTSVDFLDQQTYEGNVLSQLDEAIAFVARNTRQGIRITGKAERDTVPEYPAEAVREAIVNAICHRDYAATGTVQVRIYDDRLEVWNPGTLPADLTIEELYKEHASHPRNPRLAAALYRARIIEHWGTGTLRIVHACEAAGLPRPKFSSQSGFFVVRFTKSKAAAAPVVSPRLTERQQRAVAHVREHGSITTQSYQKLLLHLGKRQAQKDLSALVEIGVLMRRGRGPTTHYVAADATSPMSDARLVRD